MCYCIRTQSRFFHPFSAWTFFLLVMPCFVAVLLTLFWYRAPCRWLPIFLCTPHWILQSDDVAWEHPSPREPFSVEDGACAFWCFPSLTNGTRNQNHSGCFQALWFTYLTEFVPHFFWIPYPLVPILIFHFVLFKAPLSAAPWFSLFSMEDV